MLPTELGDITIISPSHLVVGPESIEKSLSRAYESLNNLKNHSESIEKALVRISLHLQHETVVEILQRAYSRILEDFETNDSDELLSVMHHVDAAMRIFGVLPSFDSSCKLRTLKHVKTGEE